MPRATPIGLAALLLASIAAVIGGLVIGGAASAPLLLDPGPLVRWGLPIVTTVTNLAAAATIGSLVLACFAIPRDRPEFERVVSFAGVGAAAWTVATVASALLEFASLLGTPIRFDEAFGVGLWQFLTTTESGVAWATAAVLVALAAVVTAFTRSLWFLALAAILGGSALVAVSQLGHVAGTLDHNVAWSALFLHMLFAALWVGGLAALAIARADIAASVDPAERGTRERTLAARYSSIALLAFVVVAGSGTVSAWLRIGGLDGLWTPYGALLAVKVAALVAIGVLGIIHRRWAIRRLPSRGAFWGIVVVELALMGVASGAAAALGATAPPVPPVPLGDSPAELLTGAPLPPPPSVERYLFGFEPDLIWLPLIIALAFFYLAGVRRLGRRGDRWPVLRTISWLSGLLVLAWITSGGINAYQDVLFSAHMLAHMVLGMLVPVLLVPGAPITLALRAIRKRDDGSRGPREWLLAIVHSPWFRLLGNPYVAAIIFVASLWVFYYTPVFRWATTTHLGHEWMILHFLLSGYLFVQALIGIDPAPNRPPYPVRLLLLLATMALHAFFGLALMTGTGLLLADWYGAMGWDLGTTALEDQQRAGGIAWSVGEIPTVALAIAVAVLWSRSDAREQRRSDRKADREGDAELEAYNRMLASRARRSDEPR